MFIRMQPWTVIAFRQNKYNIINNRQELNANKKAKNCSIR